MFELMGSAAWKRARVRVYVCGVRAYGGHAGGLRWGNTSAQNKSQRRLEVQARVIGAGSSRLPASVRGAGAGAGGRAGAHAHTHTHTPARCWFPRPGLLRPARMLVMLTGHRSSEPSAVEIRSTWPPPSITLPSTSIAGPAAPPSGRTSPELLADTARPPPPPPPPRARVPWSGRLRCCCWGLLEVLATQALQRRLASGFRRWLAEYSPLPLSEPQAEQDGIVHSE